MRRSPRSLGTSGGRLVVFLAAVVVVGGALFLAWWLRPSGPIQAEVVQGGLEHPWDLAFTDDGRMVVTERIGRVLVFASADTDASLLHTATVPDVRAELESGLMGIAIHGEAVYVCATCGADPDDPDGWRVDLLRSTLVAGGRLTPFEALEIEPAQGAPRPSAEPSDDHVAIRLAGAPPPARRKGAFSCLDRYDAGQRCTTISASAGSIR